MQIAIDGPAASGKSTAARLLTGRLGFLYIDTGAMYRAVTYKAIEKNINFDNKDSLIEIARNINMKIKQDPQSKTGYKVMVQDNAKWTDVTEDLFKPEVDRLVSIVASIRDIRIILVKEQREMARKENVVMAGRDIGSNVLPDADLKIFLVASPQKRAIRRQKELENNGEKKELCEILENIRQRDRIDSTRKDNPLVKTADAVEVDSSDLSIDEMVDLLEKYARERM
ncbi:MAG: (d)CMP kinase [Candidatus Eremiobacteraeota bacterium]|nr:(d)CMP kinase [Candidatus Eremiobacteraeota bacterium]